MASSFATHSTRLLACLGERWSPPNKLLNPKMTLLFLASKVIFCKSNIFLLLQKPVWGAHLGGFNAPPNTHYVIVEDEIRNKVDGNGKRDERLLRDDVVFKLSYLPSD